jgi:hypothetical protein
MVINETVHGQMTPDACIAAIDKLMESEVGK